MDAHLREHCDPLVVYMSRWPSGYAGRGRGWHKSSSSRPSFSSDMELGPHPAGTRSSQRPGAARFQEKPLALEFNTELATWSTSLADARVSGCSAGAPRECATRRALGIPCHRGSETLPTAPAAALQPSWLWLHVVADGRAMAGGAGRRRLRNVAATSQAWVSWGELSPPCTSGPLMGTSHPRRMWALTLPRLLGLLGRVSTKTPDNCLAGVAQPV